DQRQKTLLFGGTEMSATAQQIGEQDRERALVHLHTAPIRLAVEPHVLRPMPVRLLNGHQIAEGGFRLVDRARCEKCARGLDEIARPDQMIAAEILVSSCKAQGIDRLAMTAPGNERARCDASTAVLTR